MKFAYVLAALVVVFSGCVTHKSQPQLGYTVTLPQPDRIRFSGKGAGAGVMMASTVGPMGIAIGVAIDEGIAKNIQESLDESGNNVALIIDQAFVAAVDNEHGLVSCSADGVSDCVVIQVTGYGFRAVPGGGDRIAPVIEGTVTYRDHVFDFATVEQPSYSVELKHAKINGALVSNLLHDTFLHVFSEWAASEEELLATVEAGSDNEE